MQIPFYDQASAFLRKITGQEQSQQERVRTGFAAGPGDRVTDQHLELGWGGTSVFGGVVLDDYNPDLLGTAGIRKADEMRRSLGQVRAVTKAITLPITSTPWYLEEPKDASASEKEATELIRQNLFGGMVGQSWDALLREACLAIYFGFRVPEIVWEERAGTIAIRKVASRNLELVERWIYHPNGDLAGYLYSGNRPSGNGLDNWGTGTTTNARIPIPIEKTLHFAYDQENENPAGFGLWRSQYPHWYFVFALYKIMGIGVERNLLGVPCATEGDESQTNDRDYMEQQLSWLRAGEKAAFVLPKGWELHWFESTRTPIDALPLVEHHLRQIALAGLAQFLNLGMSSAGTQSLGVVHAKLFEQSEDGAAKWIRETIEEQLIKRWVLLNYGAGIRAPRLMHKPIKAVDLQSWATALNTLGSGGWLHATVDDEAKLREEFELSEIPKEQLLQMEEERKAEKEADRQAQRERITLPAGGDKTKPKPEPASDPCGGEQFADPDAEQLRKQRDRQEQDFAERCASLLSGMQEDYLAALRPLVEKSHEAGALSSGKPLLQLTEVAVPGARTYAGFLRSYLRGIFDTGRHVLASETGQDADAPIPNRTRSWINARAAVLAADHVQQLRTAVLTRVLGGIRAEMAPSEIFSDAGATAIAELGRNAVRDWGAAAAELLDLVNAEVG